MEKKLKKIYIICGKARSGKDTLAAIMKDLLEAQDKKVIVLQYASYLKEYAKKVSDWDGSDETKPRELLQTLGTDIIRKEIDNDFFTTKMIEDIKVYSYFFDIIIISDARFKNEIKNPLKEFDGIETIHITRPNFDNGLSEEQKKHLSEIDLDDYNDYTHEIINDGSIDDLKDKIDSILRR